MKLAKEEYQALEDIVGPEYITQEEVIGESYNHLVDAPPTGVSRDIHHRRQGLTHAHRAHLSTDEVRHSLDQLWRPRRRQADGRRKVGCFWGDESVERFVVDDDRDAQARVLDQELLDAVGCLGHPLRRLVTEHSQHGNLSHPLAQDLGHLVWVEPPRAGKYQRHHGAKLGDLFFERHTSEQFPNTSLYPRRKFCIAK